MAMRQWRLFGFRATLVAGGDRAGLEVSVPIGALRRSRAATAPEALLPVPPPDHAAAARGGLAARVAQLTWYHTLDLGGGVVTPGFYDHRQILPRYRLPERLDGLRVLDIATFDGFWAFEFERRGAAEVVALDIASLAEVDLPYRVRRGMAEADLTRPIGAGFRLAHETLRSRVRHEHCNVYDLSPERLGRFDLVHCGDLLLHLRDPARALVNIRSVTRGSALISDCIYPDLDRHDLPIIQYEGGRGANIWWRFGANALRAMIGDAGFDSVEEVARFRYGARGGPESMWHAVYRAS
jgi:tRNA (mo5U34)-methyltransferase